jgi:hypothetical protein
MGYHSAWRESSSNQRADQLRQALGLVLLRECLRVGDQLQADVGDRFGQALGVAELEDPVFRGPCDQGWEVDNGCRRLEVLTLVEQIPELLVEALSRAGATGASTSR